MSKISGIYAIRNKANDKLYVGSSMSVRYRWKQQHRTDLRRGLHYNFHLQRAWNKYGENNFEFIVLEECDENLLVEREGYWIEHHKSWDRNHGYNLNRYVDGRIIFSEETRQLMSQVTLQSWKNPKIRATRCKAMKECITPEKRKALAEARRKDYLNEDYRNKRSKTMAQTWKKQEGELKTKMKAAWDNEETRMRHKVSCTEEARRKMSEASKKWHDGQPKKVILQLTPEGELVKEWESLFAARKEFGNHVSCVLNGKRPYCGGYIWKYK
jgi:group I intron endonuclease